MIDTQTFAPIIRQHCLSPQASWPKSYTWTVPCTLAFDELLLSWNAERPLRGHYVILSSIYYRNQWSPWLLYAIWGSQYQYSFHDATSQAPVRSYQDQIEILDGEVATGFRIRIEACEGATLENFHSLYVCTSLLKSSKTTPSPLKQASISLNVPGLSQLCLNHPRSTSFCSPTSTTAVIRYILATSQLDPLQFAKQVYDAGFDIYGNWSFNLAQAFVELGTQWQCFYGRAAGFETIQHYLNKGIPVVVSVKGTLPGTLLPYTNGHLIAVKGYDGFNRQIFCMDPAFPTDDQTSIAYPWEEFMQAWAQRHYLTYFFFPKFQFLNSPRYN
jgi:hypothetical protein